MRQIKVLDMLRLVCVWCTYFRELGNECRKMEVFRKRIKNVLEKKKIQLKCVVEIRFLSSLKTMNVSKALKGT